jgi:hypothetical protein
MVSRVQKIQKALNMKFELELGLSYLFVCNDVP